MNASCSIRRRMVSRFGRLDASVAIATAGLIFNACSDATGPLPLEGPPDELKFSVVTFEGVGGSSWELQGDTLVYSTTGFSTPAITATRTVPSAEAWRSFWRETERVGLRRWRRNYTAEGIVDGVGWSTRVRARNVVIESGGSNAYPDEFGREHEGNRTAAFDAYVAALHGLAGLP